MIPKYYQADVIVEAFKLNPKGAVESARVYLRRGRIFSDVVLVSRQDLISMHQKGMRIMLGKRTKTKAGSFTDLISLHIVMAAGQHFFSLISDPVTRDSISGVPII